MNRKETLMALRMVAAYQPGQKTDDEFTAEAWVDAFNRHDFLDVRDAIKKLGTEPRRDGDPFYFDLRDVLHTVNTAVAARAAARPVQPPPNDLTPIEYRQWLVADARSRNARDWQPAQQIDAPARPIRSLVQRVGQIRAGAHPTKDNTP